MMLTNLTTEILVLHDISQLLNTQLDKETLATCVNMIESGVNPEALAVSWIEVVDAYSEQKPVGCYSRAEERKYRTSTPTRGVP